MKNYKDMPDHARVWIYQCNRFLSEGEQESVKSRASAFIEQWNSHGNELDATYELFYGKFLVFFVDEQQASVSGCSIDKSVALMKELENELGVGFFDRMLIAYKDGDKIEQKQMNDFWALRKANIVTNDTIVFNNLVANKGEFVNSWQVPFSESWHAEMW